MESIGARGCDLSRVACKRDLEGIVGKWARGTYQSDRGGTAWLKIKDPDYSQIVGLAELFDARHTAKTCIRRPTLRLV